MSKKKPDISVVIPTLNEQMYLEKSLSSLRSQFTSRSYEIIIADGHSEDRTVEIAEKYADRIIYERRRTIAAGRCAGALAAQGKVIVSAGADIYVDEYWLDRITRPVFEKTHVASIGPVVPMDGNVLENVFSHGIVKPLGSALSFINAHLVVADNMAVDAEIYRKAGGFNPGLVTGEDTDLIRRVRKFGKVAYLSEAHAYVSMRRVREWGYLKYLGFHASNFLRYHLRGTAHDKYEPVR